MKIRPTLGAARTSNILGFILVLAALHLLVCNDAYEYLESSFPPPLSGALPGPSSTTLTRGTGGSRVDCGGRGRVNRQTVPISQSREPNSRDSAEQPRLFYYIIHLTYQTTISIDQPRNQYISSSNRPTQKLNTSNTLETVQYSI